MNKKTHTGKNRKTRIKCNNLTKIFGENEDEILGMLAEGYSRQEIREKTDSLVALNNISLDIKEGEIFVIMGLSGCGKSTLLRCLNRLVYPTEGEVIIDNTDITSLRENELVEFRREKLGMVFQHFGLFPHKNVIDNAAYGLEVQGVSRKKRRKQVKNKLEMVGLEGWEESYPHELSGGMQQRVGLARALAMEPEILLMDEPFSALDPLIRTEMQDELLDLKNKLRDITIVFVTHDFNEAVKMGNRIAIIDLNGQIIQYDKAEEIIKNPANDYVKKFVNDVDRSRVLTAEQLLHKPEFIIKSEEDFSHIKSTISDAVDKHCFIVNEENEPLGMISHENMQKIDSRKKMLAENNFKPLPCVKKNTLIAEFWQKFDREIKYVFVVGENGKFEGVIETIDILKALASNSD